MSELEDQTEQLTRELSATRRDMEDLNEEKRFLEDEVKKVKDMLRSTLEQKAAEQTQHLGIIRDYKDITSSLSRRLDQTEIELARVLRRKPSTMKVTVGNSDMQLTKRVLHTCLPPQLVAELIHTNCPVCLPFLDHHLPTWRQSVSSSTSASCSYTSTSTSISTNANSVIDMISLPQKAALSPPTTGLVGSEVPDRVTPEFDATNLLPEELALENNLESECLEHEEQLMTMRAKINALELELADSKLATVEAHCRFQTLAHDHQLMKNAHSQLQLEYELAQRPRPWLSRTLSSLRSASGGMSASASVSTVGVVPGSGTALLASIQSGLHIGQTDMPL